MTKNLNELTNEQLCQIIQITGDKDALEALFINNQNLIHNISNKYAFTLNHKLDKEDLFQVGAMGLLKAAKAYKFDKNAKFSTYAYTWIKKYMMDEINKNGYTIPIPRNMFEKIMKYSLHPDRYYKDRQEVLEDKDTYLSNVSLDSYVDDKHSTILDTMDICNDYQDTETIVNKSILNSSIHDLVNSLDPLESKVITYRYGLNDGINLNVSETSRLLNITRDKVYSAEKRALEKLKDLGEKQGLLEYVH